jgi:dipeptidyl aminopeptidase/acylaminoacyl peptidase
MVVPIDGGDTRTLASEVLPADFPTSQLLTPKSISFPSSDGFTVRGQLFEKASGPAKKPALIYIHGGPMRQMLAGWHMSDYYSNAYAMNQYFASRGYVVLAVNYRLGIGYGFDFHQPPNSGTRGASEYLDIRAAGEYLKALPQVDPKRIGVYGGSYGGYLVALALGKDSGLFAAGVDIHGVHDRTIAAPSGYEKAPDWEKAIEVSWKSSPVAYVSTWKSPVLLIHADDDRNVRFSQTVDLVQRLHEQGVRYEEIVIPDDTHHFFRFANLSRVARATAEFLDRELGVR